MSLVKPWIDPAHPPLPTPMNLPFQFSVGSHSSTLILESAVGLRIIVTRQCAGIVAGGWGACAGAAPRPAAGAAPRPAGAAPRAPPPPPRSFPNAAAALGAPLCGAGPSGTSAAAVIVVSGSGTDLRFS